MENKKTFGEYICRRRKELGLTQRAFADQLYVTESAVSKWERGMSYPDITLLLDICAVLDVTEHELLTASVDTQKRSAERMAEQYRRLTRNFCIFLSVIFGGVLIGCGIACIVSGDLWILLIAAAAVAAAASITLLPFLLARQTKWEPYKWAASLAAMVASVEALILFCCLRAGSMHWFPMVFLWVLFGSCLLLLPVTVPALPLPPVFTGRRASLILAADTAALLLALAALGFAQEYHAGWFPVAFTAALFGTGFLSLPVYLRQLPLPEALKRCKATLFLGIQTALLLLLIAASCALAGGAAWRACPTALAGTLFGLSAAFLPIPLRQLPLPDPLGRHKALAYFAVNTLLLFSLLAITTGEWFLPMSLPIALLGLTLPWGLMGLLRYLPVSGWFRGSLCWAWSGLWLWLFPWAVDRILLLNGWANSTPYRLQLPVDFSRWGDARTAGWNVFLLVLLALGVLAAAFAAAGIAGRRKQRG